MTKNTRNDVGTIGFIQLKEELQQLDIDELKEVQTKIATELDRRNNGIEDAENVNLINGKWVKWRSLSAHPNLKAVKPWILRVTGTHDKFGVDGDWLDKQKIDGKYHMDVNKLENRDIIKVSGASHNNRKHRYYRVLEITDDQLYYEPKRGLKEASVLEEFS